MGYRNNPKREKQIEKARQQALPKMSNFLIRVFFMEGQAPTI
jgi:hypothetical protein